MAALQAEERETGKTKSQRKNETRRTRREKERTVVLSIAVPDGVDEVSTLIGSVGAEVVLLVAGLGESGVEFARRDGLIADEVASSSDWK